MKPVFLLGWVCFALMLLAAPAIAQEKTKKEEKRIVIIGNDTIINGNVTKIPSIKGGPDKDSLVKAMNKLGAEMNKLADELSKNSAKIGEKYKANIEKEMEKLGAEMDKLGKALEKEVRSLERERESAGLEEQIEAEIEEEMEELEEEMEEHAGSGEVKDTTRNKTVTITDEGIHIRTGKNNRPKNVVKRPKNSATDFLLLDLGVNVFTHNRTFDLPAKADVLDLRASKSINTTLHIFRTGVNIYRHKLYTTFGLTYDMHDYRFTKNTTLVADTNQFAFVESPIKLDKNKLSAQYLTLPVMLHFETNPLRPSQSFKLGVGGWGGFLVNSYTKQKSEQKGKQHLHDNFNLNALNYGVRGQIGYGMFTLYSQYALSPLFRKNANAPELNPITFGVVLNGFKWN